jgi:hypothetical protein
VEIVAREGGEKKVVTRERVYRWGDESKRRWVR